MEVTGSSRRGEEPGVTATVSTSMSGHSLRAGRELTSCFLRLRNTTHSYSLVECIVIRSSFIGPGAFVSGFFQAGINIGVFL